jgi:hypothetical protein
MTDAPVTEETTVEEAAPEETPVSALPAIKTAFVIAVDADGRVYLEFNPDILRIDVEREASLIEVRRYLSEILMDLQAQAAAEYTITALTARTAAPAAE